MNRIYDIWGLDYKVKYLCGVMGWYLFYSTTMVLVVSQSLIVHNCLTIQNLKMTNDFNCLALN